MRVVMFDISKFGLNVDDEIEINLIDSVGNLLTTSSGYSLNKKIILTEELQKIELQESEYIDVLHFYKIKLPNESSFIFNVPFNSEKKPHDLISLFKLACYKGIINQEEKSLSRKFTNKLDIYFTGKNPHFTNPESEVVRLYEYYADEIKETTSTIDIMKMMDEYLSTLGKTK